MDEISEQCTPYSKEIPFLDTKVKVDHTGKLYTDLYSIKVRQQ